MRPNTQQNLNIYEYRDYKALLRALIDSYPKGGRGIRKALAESIRCQVAYVSHVLAGSYHFSVEQAEGAARFFGLSRDESEYLLLLVSQNRAGTKELQSFLDRMLDDSVRRQKSLKSRAKIKETIDRVDQATYYSHWYYGAVHMLLTIPELRTREAISRRLKLTPRKVSGILDFLIASGLVKKEGAQFLPFATALHLEGDSPLIARHHTNWRLCSISSLSEERPNDLHYSGVVTCSENDLPKVRERIAQCLEECVAIIKPSKEERLVGLCLDWFEV
jgi:uncharacterized protein (TIGR02147 family)